jgi:hypothetical protein
VSAIGLRWFGLVLIGSAALAGACSDDEPATGRASSNGGEGGEGDVSEAGQATAGTLATTGGAGGQGEGGVAGIAGMPHVPTPAEQCSACGASECKAELDACGANPECLPWVGCLSACTDAACVTKCDADYADVARVYSGIYDCLCNQCEDDCSVVSACEKSTCTDDAGLEPISAAPATLAETGLYAGYEVAQGGAAGVGGADGAGGAPALDPAVDPLTLAPYVKSFEPKYPLWADGLKKDRFIYIPKCSTIDNSDPDHWRFPVGTRLWKQFSSIDDAGATRIETRMMHHYGPAQTDWLYAAYQWDSNAPGDPAAAVAVPAGVIGDGTAHDIPSEAKCKQCHEGLPEKVLGFGSIQLSHASSGDDLTLAKLVDLAWLTDAVPDGGFEVPGTPVQQAALGYLHGNCGGCHFQGTAIGGATPLVMRLLTSFASYDETDTVKSAVGVATASANVAISGKPRIDEAGDPTNSSIVIRMSARGVPLQMPPLSSTSTKVADTEGGVADVTAWVESLQ